MASLKLVCLLLACMVMMSAPLTTHAITCTQVVKTLSSCIPYLTTNEALTPACCNGVSALNAAAKTTPDRQQTCECLKSAASSNSGVNAAKAAGLPKACGVNIPYKISTSTDCKTVK